MMSGLLNDTRPLTQRKCEHTGGFTSGKGLFRSWFSVLSIRQMLPAISAHQKHLRRIVKIPILKPHLQILTSHWSLVGPGYFLKVPTGFELAAKVETSH